MRTIILVVTILCCGLTLFTPKANAQGGVPLWTNFYNGPGNDQDLATAIAVDNNGNVFVTGSSVGASGYQDYATVAYSSAGVPLWTNRYDGPGQGDDSPAAIAVDNSGNVFVTGSSLGTSSPQDYDYATIAYSSVGLALWTNRYNSYSGTGTGFKAATPKALAADTNGNIFVTGQTPNGSYYDFATIKYSGAGAPLWTNLYNGPADASDGGNALAVDSNGDVLVAGYSYNGSSYDYLTIKYSNAGTLLWTMRYNGGGGDNLAYALALDKSGNVFVTGRSSGIGTGDDYATVAYSGTGLPLWTNRYNGPGSSTKDDIAFYIAVDSGGNVFVTGYSTATNGYSDYATVAYSSAGVPLWTNRYRGPGQGDDSSAGIAVDRGGNVFVTGYSTATNGSSDYATVAYSSAGVPLWTNRYDGPGQGYDYPAGIAVDRDGNILVTGYSWNGSNRDYVTIKYSSSVPSAPVRLDFQRLNNQLVLSWLDQGFGLQSAPVITGTFTNIPGATSPYTNSLTDSQRYFRLQAN